MLGIYWIKRCDIVNVINSIQAVNSNILIMQGYFEFLDFKCWSKEFDTKSGIYDVCLAKYK